MANYKELIPFIQKFEGGFVNDPDDRGGATNRGVTFATWKVYCRRHMKVATVDTLKAMTDAEWNEIFKTMYWDKAQADHINNQAIANLLVDFLWHSGTVAVRHLQRLVDVKADGIVGPKTIAAINNQGALSLFWKFHQDRIDFLTHRAQRMPSQRKFLNGWLNRVNAIQFDQLKLD